ncbi:hypothetical protein AMS68_003207 [Peltaster fructicola]|uniref:Uncharacterized protein n=1 Tax=Peltaster fructicola TaxID=286661 RepID=A0A6H0XTA7_9PEZI|nr:hypothetical protein AMS68_003207 [Peltaster fructicola]
MAKYAMDTNDTSEEPEVIASENQKYINFITKSLQDLNIPDQTSQLYKREDNRVILEHFLWRDELWLGTPEIQRVLHTHALKWATEAPYLMHAILSGSAAHLSWLNPNLKQYDVAQHIHYALSLQHFAAQLSKPITQQNMDPLIACSILHGPMDFRKQGEEDTDDMLFASLRTLRGVPIILKEVSDQSWIEQSAWHEYNVQAGGHVGKALSLPEDSTVVPWARHVIEKFEELCEMSIEEDTSVYAAPLRHLGMLMRMNDHHNRSSATLRFNSHLSQDFVNLLEGGDTKALLIFCYWDAEGCVNCLHIAKTSVYNVYSTGR